MNETEKCPKCKSPRLEPLPVSIEDSTGKFYEADKCEDCGELIIREVE